MAEEGTGTGLAPADSASNSPLKEISLSFLRLGTIAFGGPAAHIAMMEEEFVRRRGWISHREFLDMLGASNLIPGPSSTEMAIHIGHRRGGWRGLIIAGACFILPAFVIVTGCAWAYSEFGALPRIQYLLYGVKPVIIAVVLQALCRLVPIAAKGWFLAAIAVFAASGALVGGNVLLILLIAGFSAMLIAWVHRRLAYDPPAMFSVTLFPAKAAAAGVPIGLGALFTMFLKFGAVIFGSGYVLLAFLQADLVDRLHWLSQAQLLDAIAVGQMTPGPVLTTATFIGYLLGGLPGALVATLGIFLPSFLLVAVSRPLIPRIRDSKVAGAFLDGVNAGAVGLISVVTWQLGRAAVIDILTATLAAMSAVLLLGWQINSAWLLLAGGLVGVVAKQWLGI